MTFPCQSQQLREAKFRSKGVTSKHFWRLWRGNDMTAKEILNGAYPLCLNLLQRRLRRWLLQRYRLLESSLEEKIYGFPDKLISVYTLLLPVNRHGSRCRFGYIRISDKKWSKCSMPKNGCLHDVRDASLVCELSQFLVSVCMAYDFNAITL